MESKIKELIEQTFTEIGIKGISPLRSTIFVRTEKPQDRIGLIWLPPKTAGFYGEMMHRKLILATVLASGPKCEVKPGDRIAFVRQYFARYVGLRDEQFVGWIDENQVAGFWDAPSTTA